MRGHRGSAVTVALMCLLGTASAATADTNVAPRTAVLVVDTSGSMAPGGIEAARRAARGYADTVASDVRVGLVAFADRPQVLTPATMDRAALRAGIARMAARGETALYDAVVLAAGQVGVGGSLVVLSDGGDTASRADLEAAVAAVTGRALHVDVVAFSSAESEHGSLARIAAAGRGRVVTTADAAELARAFAAAASSVVGTPSVGVLDTARPRELAVERLAAPPSWLTPSALGRAFAAVLLPIAVGLTWPAGDRERQRRRRRDALQAYALGDDLHNGASAREGASVPEGASASGMATRVLAVAQRLVSAGGRQAAVALRLDRAGLTLLPHEWLVLRVAVALVGAAGGVVLVPPRVLGLLVGLAAGLLAAGVWLRSRENRRCRAFAEQLPDTLQSVASSLRSGFSLQQALASAQETTPPPMASELGRALSAARIGAVLEDELDLIGQRMRSDDWRMAVMAIRIQRTVGGNLAEVLSTTARTLRERSAVVRQVRALSAEGRLSAYVLLGLPVAVGLFLLVFRRAYLEPLWTTTAGAVLLVVSALGMGVGTWWTLKVAEVKA